MEAKNFVSYSSVSTPIILFIVTQIVLDLVWRISNFAEWKAEPYVRRSIILQSYDYVQHHSYAFFQDNFTGFITSKIKGLVSGYDKFWAEIHHGFFAKVLKILVNLCALAFVNMYLGSFVLIWGVIYAPIMFRLSNELNKYAFRETESKHALFGQISDKISNIISLFSFSARKRELRYLDNQISYDFIPKQIQLYKYAFFVQLIGGLLYLVMFAFILFYMVYLRINGLISVGDFAFVFSLALVIAEDIWDITTALQDFARSMGDIKSCLSILMLPHQMTDVSDAHPIIVTNPKIEFHNVSFSYDGTKYVIKNINLTIHAGEKIGIVGRSGSGKSSIISLLLRYFKNNEGDILIDNQNIKYVTQESLRSMIAVIPQDTLLFHRTLMENIRYGNPSATDEEVIAACEQAHIHKFIMRQPQGYNTYAGERGVKLSGGQRQRIAIARAILKNAPILILDEATSSLDSYTESLVQDSLNILMADKQKTVIAIAHRLSTLKHMDRIIVLDKGAIIEEGTHDQLIAQPDSLYKKLWDYQEI